MVVTDSEMISQGEVESPLQSEQQPKNHPFSSLGRQSSIYSLTLDEFQHTLCESGKNFGSMNMDEFLTSIWTVEENQATNHTTKTSSNNNITQLGSNNGNLQGLSKQLSLSRQGSLSLPAPLCRKTVDEVWSEIHRGQSSGGGDVGGVHGNGNGNGNGIDVHTPEAGPRQPTFGEMTLEDFLIKAGVVREQQNGAAAATQPVPTQQQQYGLYQGNNSNTAVGTGFVTRPMMGIAAGGSGGGGGSVAYQGMPQGAGPIGGESSGRNGGYQAPAAGVVQGSVYGGRSVGDGGGYVPAAGGGMALVGPVSPVSSEGMVGGIDSAGNQFGMDISGLRGRKRIIDGPVEKVVERRQRRMIKNRESAARSRARKQAYTVELEAELNQLKEENKQLKQALAELERKRKQQQFEDFRMKFQTRSQKAKEKLRLMRRNLSCPL
ncbi:hypothetical protein Tsubulata_036096 [Turnera subulata]|uniref:BZIP domain-containing protein n=1 Tax=Turnera subulata TaxID=218843 RepID=A0A9Q0F2M3_9ROSI|nr:hypothetical protein Tsubulata_036096 [Turnera subulata]